MFHSVYAGWDRGTVLGLKGGRRREMRGRGMRKGETGIEMEAIATGGNCNRW
jgi:hypothetical protein